MVRTQVQLTEEQAFLIKKVAMESHISVAEAIRQGIDAFLRSTGPSKQDERLKRALAAAGRFRSGKRDISRRHNTYLAEAFHA
jgi:hypothetical protein